MKKLFEFDEKWLRLDKKMDKILTYPKKIGKKLLQLDSKWLWMDEKWLQTVRKLLHIDD